MGKISKNIFTEGSDSDTELKTENEYAKNYDAWRKREELNKLKTKYGDNVMLEDSESSSSSDDEDAAELTEEVEKDFFKTLSYLKKKDPKIYDNSVTFFKSGEDGLKKEKKKKEEPMYLKDYERILILEKGGVIENDTSKVPRPATYVKEEKQLQEEIIKQAAKIEDEDENELGGLLQVRNKSKEETEKEAEYLKWLTGQTDEIEDEETKTELKPLKEFWDNPKLDDEEKFLRDYVLKKRYLEKDEDSYVPTYEEIIHDSDESLSGDEKEVQKQEEFEHKYNFRFEEPDQEFIKRYPRTIEKSLRKTDDRRKIKRAETKERKKKEKEEKMAEIKKLQELKRKEIEEKIEKLKEITGNDDVGFQEDDIDGDFDPEAHDRMMQSRFNDDFYEGQEGDQKPEFPDIDKELEIENWDQWNGEDNIEQDNTEYEPHCEDDSFNMDADYDPSTSAKQEVIENTTGRKKRRRKSKVAEALGRPKPKYDPNDKNYEKYFDEYYKLDCEDVIGDIPCRFKYRDVIPNDFGLTIEEILLAKDKELNRWCSLKKAVQHRPANIEKYDQIAYARKANNINLKKQIIPSLFSEEAGDNQNVQQPSTSSRQDKISQPNSEISTVVENESNNEAVSNLETSTSSNNNNDNNNTPQEELLNKSQLEKRKKKNKKKKKKTVNNNTASSKNEKDEIQKDGVVHSEEGINKKKKKNIRQENSNNESNSEKKNRKRKQIDSENNKPGGKKFKKNVDVGISDARLSAYGINPKKFKNKLKYGNKNKD